MQDRMIQNLQMKGLLTGQSVGLFNVSFTSYISSCHICCKVPIRNVNYKFSENFMVWLQNILKCKREFEYKLYLYLNIFLHTLSSTPQVHSYLHTEPHTSTPVYMFRRNILFHFCFCSQ